MKPICKMEQWYTDRRFPRFSPDRFIYFINTQPSHRIEVSDRGQSPGIIIQLIPSICINKAAAPSPLVLIFLKGPVFLDIVRHIDAKIPCT